MEWKLVIAADAPWTGEIYRTHPGRQRLRFSTVETFCGALLAVTGWPLQAPSGDLSDHSTTRRRASANRRNDRRSGSRPASENLSWTRKLIVAADQPWVGEMYRTRPGLGHFPFGTFEEFLRAVLDITDWTLEDGPARDGDYAKARRRTVSRPTSFR
ncbi:hypothetical protein BH09ACT8_BH09ACT8_32830 [soil metagenome]